MLGLLSVQSQTLSGWAIIIVLFLYAQIGTSFFPIIFEDKLIFSLPWQLEKWRNAFSRWLSIGFIFLMILVAIPQFYWYDSLYWSIIHLISYAMIGHILYQDRLDLHIKALMQKQVLIQVSFLISFFILFFGVIYSARFPNVSILVIIYSIIRYTYQYIKN